ncbi:hypothetical protein [Mycolicibacterium fortuitum]|uniref:Uncharacterized protein n=1 Tax=Mycolicibacterium fortuitum subsp. fortuitum DSM 46621 = ATCC 6841 = JCM 6387 TaxID=1214102 RepID=K0VWG8_MYCFO|nr:hypothetical protein [Mycolicibacterium fortuitum]AIY44745.1 hypothetical protein G155_03205 [Mycobacterium sp. VKM Ac-1817D]CRL79613.1 hypothetical protein CPGR_02808 [Mycolicibacter nonchromogenicus]EJZ15789.1 hypothetical protein MFORT_02729 [Mycolicibacterium fortuitum subsp. fortuitum DSM 46621 = ATCC 6841 = JCM 6387]WEV33454.1 hypothetical protein OMF10_03285 [Mycolicibacterium fortuitum]CRL54786.1 hypothetical protein CPGR_02083 [Mycolicibacterium fortuitum subsp. fortuitum DSM 46621
MSYYSNATVADQVLRWNTKLSLDLPDELAEAIEVYRAIRKVPVNTQPTVTLSSVTTENAEAKVHELADELIRIEAVGAEFAATQRAKNRLSESAAGAVIRQAVAAIPNIVEQLQPQLDEHVRAYIEAVAALPEKLNSETLVSSGPAAVEAFAAAQRAAQQIDAISSWVANTSLLPGVGNPEPVLRVLQPENYEQLYRLDEAHRESGSPGVGTSLIGHVYLTAARLGVPFGINTLAECAELRRNLELSARQHPA